MKLLPAFIAASLATVAGAQAYNTLVCNPNGAGFTYSSDGNNFFDLTVLNPAGITLRGLTVRTVSPAGTTGTVELWMLDPTVATSHIGRELVNPAPAPTGSASGWMLISSGPFTSGGVGASTGSCQSAYTINVPDTYLAPGTYGFAIDHIGIWHVFDGLAAYPPLFTDPNVEVTNGSTQATSWTSAPLTTFTSGATTYVGTAPEISVHYNPGAVPHACASRSVFGEGSVKSSASFWQRFQSAAAASAALQGNSLQMTFTGTGYAVSRGTASYVPPTAAAVSIPAVDDGENIITPLIPVLYPSAAGGMTATDLYVHSNGYISTGPQTGLTAGPLDPSANMNADEAAWYSHHDFNPTEVGSNPIVYEEDLINGILYVTWDNVESDPPTAANPSRLQFQFNQVNGDVNIVWDLVDATGGSGIFGGDWTLIGFSPAGVSPVTEPFDFTTLTAFVTSEPEIFPLALEQVGDALVGGSVDLVTSNEIGLSVGINLISESVFPTALPLGPLGAPASSVAWLDPSLSIANLITTIPGAGSMSLTIPIANTPSLAGVEVASQSFWLDLGAPSLFTNLLSSNGVSFVVGNVSF